MTTTTTEPLTREEMQALTYYKWRYSLEATGFTKQEAARLSFQRWRRLMREGKA